MTVAEDFLLLAYNDTGRPRVDGTKLKAALAGAAILELTLAGALRLTEAGEPNHKKGRLVATGVTPDDPRLAELVTVADGRRPKDAVGKVAGFSAWRSRSRDLREALLRDLVDAGQFTESPTKVLGLFPTTLWRPNPAGEQARVQRQVRAAVVEGAEPDDRTAALVSILHAVDMLPKLFPDADKRAVKRRGKAISESNWGGAAVRKAVQEVHAVTAAVIASTAAASSGS
ncbi:GOLPH3/VPS74 family protein [Nocardia mexicana]|uniref:Golgi phosphoprotein 3 GPP34 n=1 Tax=Nocardia mexicana TaxID=279262 RepID=A0A370GEA5_9NOCA|nr:GPP34 family phosphoprotein [Nocardia mexicana]RDI42011.1 Golgi phosphoprotein 3 GPP34 [Nocardia mexicana]